MQQPQSGAHRVPEHSSDREACQSLHIGQAARMSDECLPEGTRFGNPLARERSTEDHNRLFAPLPLLALGSFLVYVFCELRTNVCDLQ